MVDLHVTGGKTILRALKTGEVFLYDGYRYLKISKTAYENSFNLDLKAIEALYVGAKVDPLREATLMIE